MRKLFLAIIGLVTALGIASAERADLSVAPDHADRAVRRRRAGGCARARARRAHARLARPDRHHRERDRRRRARSVSAASCARRPTATRSASATVGTHVVNGAIFRAAVRPVEDLEPVALLPSNSLLIVTKKALPANDLKELIAWLKANPGQGVGGHLGCRRRRRTSTASISRTSPAPASSSCPIAAPAPALTDLVAGQIDLMFDQASNSLRAGARRQDQSLCGHGQDAAAFRARYPDGRRGRLAGILYSTWYGLWAPKGTPKTGDRQAQCRGRGGAGRSGRAEAAGRPGPRISAARAADARRRSALTTRRRSRSGGRSSRRRTSRLNERACRTKHRTTAR